MASESLSLPLQNALGKESLRVFSKNAFLAMFYGYRGWFGGSHHSSAFDTARVADSPGASRQVTYLKRENQILRSKLPKPIALRITFSSLKPITKKDLHFLICGDDRVWFKARESKPFPFCKRVLHRKQISALVGPAPFDSQFENPITNQTDDLMEGLSSRTDASGVVTGRAKYVRSEFVEKIKQSTRWLQQAIVPNRLPAEKNPWS
jgi:hypothetical protein